MTQTKTSDHDLYTYLATHAVPFPEWGCFVAIWPNTKELRSCAMNVDQTPDMDGKILEFRIGHGSGGPRFPR
jgi:hypothetical protein